MYTYYTGITITTAENAWHVSSCIAAVKKKYTPHVQNAHCTNLGAIYTLSLSIPHSREPPLHSSASATRSKMIMKIASRARGHDMGRVSHTRGRQCGVCVCVLL